jgi:plastocyanin
MQRFAALAALLCLALAAPPASSADNAEQAVTVSLANFSFSPSTVRLTHGRPYALELVNTASGGHNFAAPQFFAAAQIAPADRARVAKGTVELAGGARVVIHLVAPAAGQYRVHCSHLMHSAFGMKGAIVVS